MSQKPLGRGRGRGRDHKELQPKSHPSSSRGRNRGVIREFHEHSGGDHGCGEGHSGTSYESTHQTRAPKTARPDKGEGDIVFPGPSSSSSSPKPIGRGGTRGSRHAVEPVKTRPELCISKKGYSGREVLLHTNYFQLETVADWVIFHYRVDFSIDEERVGMKKRWLSEHSEKLGRAYLFDGNSLFSPKRLTAENKPLVLMCVRESDNLPIKIEVHFVQELKYGNVIYLQVFNILLRRSLSHLKLQLISRNYYDASAAIKIPQYNFEIWPGYVTTIKQNESSILMCSEISHKIMRMDTAMDLLMECVKQNRDYKRLFQQAVVGQIVLTDYNNKTYRVDDVDFNTNPSSKFKMKDEEITFVDYYKRRYNIRIKDPKQPLLISRSNARAVRAGMPQYCLLVPELCRMTGLSDKMLENNQLKRGLSEYTRVNPAERMNRLVKFNERLLNNHQVTQEFKNWDMKLSKELVTVKGRELPCETIIGGQGQKYSAGSETDWTRELRSRPMLKTATINRWVVICPKQLKADMLVFLDALRKAASGMSFRIPTPQIYETPNDRPTLIVEAVEEALAVSRPDIIMFACPNNRSDRYNAIKKKCCVDRGVQSQVILARSLKARGLAVATKVAIQINCKMGGAAWSVEIPLQSVMVIGYDVCHDSSQKSMSYAAVVASLNNTLSSWYSCVSHHSNGEELSDALSLDVCKALKKYKEINGSLPARIIVYRDGVGEGQIPYVHEHEVKVLKGRLTEVYGGEHWKLGYIIVTKRINTRIFKGNLNPVPGTVVDDVITLPERYDFFLVSQNVNCGTVTPTNYNVISDNLGLKPDQLQRWTYKMTHLYFNWSGTVRVPAPCQYAHKLAFLVGQALHVEPHTHLQTTLHFL